MAGLALLLLGPTTDLTGVFFTGVFPLGDFLAAGLAVFLAEAGVAALGEAVVSVRLLAGVMLALTAGLALLLLGLAVAFSGVFAAWAATGDLPGVFLAGDFPLGDFSAAGLGVLVVAGVTCLGEVAALLGVLAGDTFAFGAGLAAANLSAGIFLAEMGVLTADGLALLLLGLAFCTGVFLAGTGVFRTVGLALLLDTGDLGAFSAGVGALSATAAVDFEDAGLVLLRGDLPGVFFSPLLGVVGVATGLFLAAGLELLLLDSGVLFTATTGEGAEVG